MKEHLKTLIFYTTEGVLDNNSEGSESASRSLPLDPYLIGVGFFQSPVWFHFEANIAISDWTQSPCDKKALCVIDIPLRLLKIGISRTLLVSSQGERIKLKTVEGLNTKLPKYILGINSTSQSWFSGLAFVFGGLEIILPPGVWGTWSRF